MNKSTYFDPSSNTDYFTKSETTLSTTVSSHENRLAKTKPQIKCGDDDESIMLSVDTGGLEKTKLKEREKSESHLTKNPFAQSTCEVSFSFLIIIVHNYYFELQV